MMRVYERGEYRDMSDTEIAEMQKNVPAIPYEERVAARIRAVYSVDDELAILRQRESKPDEFAEYFAFAEKVKAEEKAR